MTQLVIDMDRVLALDLAMREYPILRDKIRKRMREEIFRRGVVREEDFEEEVRTKAIATQRHEGLLWDTEPPELEAVWEERLVRVRDMLTDFYFAHNLPHSLFHSLVAELLGERNKQNVILSLNPETAPWDLLFSQAQEFESAEDEETRVRVEPYLKEIIVVLTKGMLSDQLGFVRVARQHFRICDLKEISMRRIGRGKIGGKAAGMRLARRILQTPSPEDPIDLGAHVTVPESWYVAADLNYEFIEENDLYGLFGEKYKPFEQIRADYEFSRARFAEAKLPKQLIRRLSEIIDHAGDSPLIARSSSLLEDSFGTAFAGKYESHYCPNQGDKRTRLEQLCRAVKNIYASVLNPDAIAYRKQRGLLDYDERMAILIQKVQGAPWQDHYFPQVAGVGFSHNPYRWTSQIDRRAGFLRLVWGLGTRAVNRVERDHPRLVALSHPTLRPERTPQEVQRYSQHFVDTIDLQRGAFHTIPVEQLIRYDYPSLRYIASVLEGEEVRPLHLADPRIPAQDYVITFDGLLQQPRFVTLMRAVLQKLEGAYGHPVDIEFTVGIQKGPPLDFQLCLLQCRPQSSRQPSEQVQLPRGVPSEAVVFCSSRTVSSGRISNIRTIIYVDPEHYSQMQSLSERTAIARLIGQLNDKGLGGTFILVGPGRWGSSNAELGVPVTYADLFNAAALVEVPTAIRDEEPEASCGTHFFQDLVESNIHTVAVYPERGDLFSFSFFRKAPNELSRLVPAAAALQEVVRIIDVPRYTGGKVLELVMDDSEQEGVMAFLTWPKDPEG